MKGGAGISLAGIESQNDHFAGWGWGVLAGLGYDFRVGRMISLTPVANFYFGQPGDLNRRAGRTLVSGWKQNVFDIGLGITFH